jgi:hypothetical protein
VVHDDEAAREADDASASAYAELQKQLTLKKQKRL